MPSIFPTQIQQVRDESDRAGARLVELLGSPQNSSLDPFVRMVDRATAASESQKLGDALALFQRGLEDGRQAGDILAELDPRIAGSEAFQDRAGKLRDSRIRQTAEDRAQAQWQNTLNRQAMQDEANNLFAKYLDWKQQTAGYGTGAFMHQFREQLANNPLAYNMIMKYANEAGDNLSYDPNADEKPGTDQQILSTDDVNFANRQVNRGLDLASSFGIALPEDVTKAINAGNLDDYIATEAKRRGYEGQDYSDFAHNIKDGYALLKAARPNDPESAILWALAQHIEPGTFSWVPGLGRYAQDKVDVDTAAETLRLRGAGYAQMRDNAQELQRFQNILTKAEEENTVSNAQIALDTNLRKIENLRGRVSEATLRNMRNRAITDYNTTISPIVQAADRVRAIMSQSLMNPDKKSNNQE